MNYYKMLRLKGEMLEAFPSGMTDKQILWIVKLVLSYNKSYSGIRGLVALCKVLFEESRVSFSLEEKTGIYGYRRVHKLMEIKVPKEDGTGTVDTYTIREEDV